MAFGRLVVGPALAQPVQQFHRLGRAAIAEQRARLAQHIAGLVAQRFCKDRIVMRFRLTISSARKTLFGKRRAVGNGVGDLDLILQRAILPVGIERAAGRFPRLTTLMTAEPFRDQHHNAIGDRADSRPHQDDESPRQEPAGFGRVQDQKDIDERENNNDWHLQRSRAAPPAEPASLSSSVH
jgi:hypothetical protein